MPASKGGWAYALDPAIKDWYNVGYNGLPGLRERLFDVRPSSIDSEYSVGFGGIAPEVWDNFNKAGRVPQVNFDQGYKTTFTHKLYAVEFQVQRTLYEDAQFQQAFDGAQRLGYSAAVKREVDAASVFNNYTSASYVGGDAVALCSNSHPLSPGKSGTTQDNLFASTALSATNVETVRLAMLAFTDDAGNISGVNPDLLLVPPALENTAKDICEADGQLDSADNNINPQKGRFTYIMWPRLSSSTTWFLIDSALMKQSLLWYERVAPEVDLKNEDQTIFATWIARMRYSYGWRDWRWIAGCAA